MTLKKKVLLNTAVSMTLLFSALVYLALNHSRSVELARTAPVAQAPASAQATTMPDPVVAEMQRRVRVSWYLVIGVVMFVLLERGFVIFGSLLPFARSVEGLVGRARRIAAGDLRGRDFQVQRNEIGQVLGAMNDMKANLAAMVQEVAQTAQAVQEAAQSLRASTHDLAARTEQQAASLEQTSASMREFADSVKGIAASTKEAHALTERARATAQQGGNVVGSAILSMNEISDSSQRMDEIVGVIDAIAFQTNVLALNAAVEAARAGEQGRGFGVVAAEVRSLAQRSAAAAKEVRTLIAGARAHVGSGVSSVREADGHIERIVGAVRGVHEQVSEIANACSAQALAVDQIDETVDQLQHVTSQNSVLVQRGASIAEALSEQARQLVQLVERFQLEGGVDAVAHAAAHEVMSAAALVDADEHVKVAAYPVLPK